MDKQNDDFYEDLIKKHNQEVLEISSTGYGLESVLKENEENSLSKEHNKHS